MSLHLTVQIDPHAVLGVASGATLHEIREAYHRKAKLHHPDIGGEDWAFRIVVQAYEILSTARVVRATEAELRTRSRPEPAASPPPNGGGRDSWEQAAQPDEPHAAPFKKGAESVRAGVSDRVSDPARVVDVEKLWIRFEVDNVWLLPDGGHEDRFLSCCLNISWPEPELAAQAASLPGAEQTLRQLSEVFEEVHLHTPVTNSRCKVEGGRFQGWLSYPSSPLAWKAFNKLHEELNARGLSVKQWTRDLLIPREWR